MKALISVSNKTGVVEFARNLISLGFEVISTSGTMKCLREAGLPITNISDVTGFPEICDGRVKLFILQFMVLYLQEEITKSI